jgi:beta-galactosidase
VVIHNHDLEGPYILSGTLISPDGEETDLGSYIYESSGEFDLYTLSCEVENPKTWSPNHPWLYRLVLSLKTKQREETLETKTGFRTVRIVGYGTDPGIYINDINTSIRGITRFEDTIQPDSLSTSDFIARDLDLVQDMNANFIRMAASPHDVREIRACRDRGIMVSEEIPNHGVGLGWVEWYTAKGSLFELPVKTFGMRQLNDPVLMSLAQLSLIEMVERDINNPAVIMWMVGSESYTLFDEGGRFHGWMRDVIRLFDDTRPVCTTEYTYDIRGLDSRSRTAEHMDLIAVDSFFGWQYGSYEDVQEHLDRIHRRYPDRLIFLSGFGVGSDCASSKGIDTEQYQARLIEEYVDIARSKKYVAGVCPTTFADIPHPGDMTPSLGCFGVLSADREPKAAYDTLSGHYLDIKTGGK